MPFLRFSLFKQRATPTFLHQRLPHRNFSATQYRFAQGYGDGKGDPKGENPQDQGASNDIKHNAEHPGPSPPAEGQNSGAGPTKGQKSPEESSAQSGGSRSKEAKETGSSPTARAIGGGKSSSNSNHEENKAKQGASPKIHDDSIPGSKNHSDKQAEVEQHNKEFEQGHDRAPPAAGDKVDKKFWKGEHLVLCLVICFY